MRTSVRAIAMRSRSWIDDRARGNQLWNSAELRRKVLRMSTWLTVRTFIALFLALLGIGMMFTPDIRIFVGAALAAIGFTFLVRLMVAFRANLP